MSLPTRINTKRRTEIISAAIDVLAEDGYQGASLAQIGRRVGISKGVVGYHFKHKEALIDAVIDSIYDKGYEIVRPPIDAEPTAFGKIKAFITQSVYFYNQYATYVLALSRLRLHLTNSGRPSTTLTNRLHRELSDLTDIFREGQANGEFRAFDPRIMARTLRQALDGLLIEMGHHPGSESSRYTDELVALFKYATEIKHKER